MRAFAGSTTPPSVYLTSASSGLLDLRCWYKPGLHTGSPDEGREPPAAVSAVAALSDLAT